MIVRADGSAVAFCGKVRIKDCDQPLKVSDNLGPTGRTILSWR
jgi:hypothetical protein